MNLTENIILKEGAVLKDCINNGFIIMERHAYAARCELGAYFNLGAYSGITGTQTGKYVSIGARCSVGGYEHPIDWLSTAAFQWHRSPWEAFNKLSKITEGPSQKRTVIGNDVWIGNNAIILQGVDLPNGTIVGAGSVVTKTPSNSFSVMAGNPAREIKRRYSSDLCDKVNESKWWDLDHDLLRELDWKSPEIAIAKLSQL